jgi:hypothetical protein
VGHEVTWDPRLGYVHVSKDRLHPITVAVACIASVAGRIRKGRRDVIKESPVGYLFQLEQELDPASLAERVRRSLQSR